MHCRFVIEAWTNEPIHVEVELQNALDFHAPLFGMDVHIADRELAADVSPKAVGASEGGDPWRFLVECETNSPHWTGGEIEKAVRNYEPAAKLGLEVKPGYTLVASSQEREDTADDVDKWLRKQSGGRER